MSNTESFEQRLQRELLNKKSPHFNIYYYPDSTAEREIDLIISQREKAYQKIAEYLDFRDELSIDLYFFENADLKREITGHTGAGWAYDTSMVEVYNATVKVNPYHELVHVFTQSVYGYTVSAFNEGFAVYMCKLLGDDTYDEKMKKFYENGELLTLPQLLSVSIGNSGSKPLISYPQAASFVEFIIFKLGKAVFFDLYVALHCNYTAESIAYNIETIENAYGQKIGTIEKEWLNWAI